VLPLAFVVAAGALLGLTWLATGLLHHPTLPHPRAISVHDWVSVLQLVFASVAGAGALVALIVAYRRQRVAEADSAHDRTRVFNERFIAIAGQLGHDKAAVRLAGVHAMAGLAEDWEEHRQTCVDVLCAYLRMPYAPDPGEGAPTAERLAFRADQQVRHSVIRVIADHLRDGSVPSWQSLKLDFTGVVFDGGDFRGVRFTGDDLLMAGPRPPSQWSRRQGSLGDDVRFDSAVFASGDVSFDGAKFSGGRVSFNGAVFSGGSVSFRRAEFTDGALVCFVGARFSAGAVSFDDAMFTGGLVTFAALGASNRAEAATFSGSTVSFDRATFEGGSNRAGTVVFSWSEFSGGSVTFNRADFSYVRPTFLASGGATTYLFGNLALKAGSVYFVGANFAGGEVDLREVMDWSNPPVFGFDGQPPQGVMLAEGRLPAHWLALDDPQPT
jgi:uncharacterized protein YjbI with pentapeptide repeats